MKRLHYVGGATAEIEVIKEGRKWLYFRVRLVNYRLDKLTGEVQVGPYWHTARELYVD